MSAHQSDPVWDAFQALPITYGPRTERQALALERAEREIARGEYVSHASVLARHAAEAKRARKAALRERNAFRRAAGIMLRREFAAEQPMRLAILAAFEREGYATLAALQRNVDIVLGGGAR